MFEPRVEKLRGEMRHPGLDAAILTSEPNMLYLSGYSAVSLERLIALLIFREQDKSCLIVPELERERAEENCKLQGVEILSYRDNENPVSILVGLLSKNRVSSLGVEGSTPYRFIYPLHSSQPPITLSLIDDIMYSLRIVKDEREVECLEKAAEINNKLLIDAVNHVKPGLSERDLASFVRARALELGADEVAFVLIQSGSNSALPHQEPTTRKISSGDIVLFDIGIRYMGYYSDITRTVTYDKPLPRQQEIFEIVERSQSEALSKISEGARAQEIDGEARRIITEAGYGRFFIHRTGHGLGLEVHEPPYIREGNLQELRRGMVFTVEPGIYLAGEFGVRLEDNVIVSGNGYRNLTKLPKSLQIKDYA
ncbi:MAG: Xaa-Pro peptidase family protein [Nitrososphaerota archaeon]